MSGAVGIRIRHLTKRFPEVALVPVISKPFFGASLDTCPTCRVIHPCKTVHLWLDDMGSCLVSQGVLDDLLAAGMPELQVIGGTESPPDLDIGMPRQKQDQEARKLIIRR